MRNVKRRVLGTNWEALQDVLMEERDMQVSPNMLDSHHLYRPLSKQLLHDMRVPLTNALREDSCET